jgi:hypothetical protein
MAGFCYLYKYPIHNNQYWGLKESAYLATGDFTLMPAEASKI